jgi:putative transposase
MPRPTVSLELTAEEREDLQSIATSRSMPHGLVRRAQLILWSESGVPLTEVGRRLKLSGGRLGPMSWIRLNQLMTLSISRHT